MPAARRPPARRPPGRGGTEQPARERPARRRPRPAPTEGGSARASRRSDLLPRIVVAVPAAVIAIAFVDVGGIAFAAFMIVIALVCLHELYRLLPRWRPAPIVGFASATAMVLAAHFGTERTVLEVAVITLPVTFLVVIASGQGGTPTVSIAGTLLGVYWIGFAFAHAELLRGLPHGNAVLIDVMVGTFLGDTGAYIGGRLFGRRPLAPDISPSKTVEGLFCGMLVAIVAVFVAGLYQTWMTPGDSLALGVAVAVLGPLGDLFESLVKRDAGAKDSGTLFGAHGGALDRLDAIIFTVVAGYYVWLGLVH